MQIRLGGVPEHFNYMWQLPVSREIMRKQGIVYHWTDFPGGTGDMSQALELGSIDMAIMLTEGAIAAISNGKEFKILFPFVMSPLLWGVFVNQSRIEKVPENLEDAKFAISRWNSGSHLMAKFLAQRQGINLLDKNFVISNNLAGAREKLKTGEADYFLWEKYMTKPLVHSGEFLMTDEVSAPWPSFVFVVNRNFKLDADAWKESVYALTSEYLLDSKDEIVNGICKTFDLTAEDAESWLAEVRYYDNNEYWRDRMVAATIIMKSKGLIENAPDLSELI